MEQKAKLTFCGGAGVVTGANFLFECGGVKMLVDCGFEQGGGESHAHNAAPFAYDPNSIKMLFITHAHADHVGRIPKLVKDGFTGVIYSTPETKAISEFMLDDSAGLLLREAGEDMTKVLYTQEHVNQALRQWQTIPYHVSKDLGPCSVYLKDAGHILGSTMYEFTSKGSLNQAGDLVGQRKIVFTGDLGNSPTPLLRDTEDVTDADYMVMESVYGDRNHEPKDERDQKFRELVKSVIAEKGVLVIPAFSLERTQVILYELNEMVEHKEVPMIPVYLDSPLAIKVTEIYRQMGPKEFNPAVEKEIAGGEDIFKFPGLHFTTTTEESKAILHSPDPKIIIAGSGMSNGGRILHHEKNYLPNPNATLLLIGYEAVGTLGRQIQDGAKTVNIYGEQIPVRAHVEMISGYSSHKDSDHLVEFVSHTAEKVKKVFVAMGEPKSSLFLVQRLRDNFEIDAVVPKTGESFELDF